MQLLEDHFDLFERLEKMPKSSNAYKVTIRALERTSLKINVMLDQVADNSKPTEVIYE